MRVDDLRNAYFEAEQNRDFLGREISTSRLTLTRAMLEILRTNPAELREPLYNELPEHTLAVVDNITKATYISRHLQICLTQHYVTPESQSTMPLPPKAVEDLLARCDTTLDEVLSLIKMAREIEIAELRKLNAIGFAIERQ